MVLNISAMRLTGIHTQLYEHF